MIRASLSRVAMLFLRAGTLTFGGGNPTMAALYNDLVAVRGWITSEQYGLVYALARLTPGTNLLAFGAGIAWQIGGWKSAALAVLAMSVPAAFVTVLLTIGYDAWKQNFVAMSAIAGVLAASVGLMASSAWQLIGPQLLTRNWRRIVRAAVIASGAFFLAFRFSMPPIQVLLLAALGGFLWQEPQT
jgi:chromate transporter